MLKKMFQPKVLAIITIVSMIISACISIVNSTIIGGGSGFVGTLIGNILNGYVYIIIYLLIILLTKKKNIRRLNLIMIVQLSIALILVVFSNIVANVFELNHILNIVPYAILLIMAIGVHFHKETLYKPLMILSIIVLTIQFLFVGRLFIVGTFASPTILYVGNKIFYNIISLFVHTIGNIGLCSFTIFMYQYGNSISQRSNKNE